MHGLCHPGHELLFSKWAGECLLNAPAGISCIYITILRVSGRAIHISDQSVCKMQSFNLTLDPREAIKQAQELQFGSGGCLGLSIELRARDFELQRRDQDEIQT